MEIYLEFAENKAIGAKRQGQQEESKHRAIPIPLTFLCSNVLSSCFCAVGLIQFMKKALLQLLASGGTTHRPRTYRLQGSAVPPDRRRPRNGLHGV